jgi:hypothetical protein
LQRNDALRLLGGALALSASGCGWDTNDAAPVPKFCGTPSTTTRFGSVIYGADDVDEALKLIAGCGGTLIRMGVDGESLDRADVVVPAAAKYGMRVVFISPYSPQPVDGASYGRECAAIHRRYDGYDPIWEIWNEPDLASYWGATPNVYDYAKLALAAGTVLRANGASEVWSGGTSGIHVRWTDALLAQGVYDVLNGCAVHSYVDPSAAFAQYVALRKLLPANIPIHTTETCIPSSQDQSAFLTGMWYIHRNLGLPTLVWCELRDSTAGNNPPYNYPYGLLYSDYRPKPSYDVAKALTSSCR